MLKHYLTSITRIRMQQARVKMTQTELASITAISQETISKIERGKQNTITEDQLEKIARATGVSRAWLMGQSNEGGPNLSSEQSEVRTSQFRAGAKRLGTEHQPQR